MKKNVIKERKESDTCICEGCISMDEFEEACCLLGQHTASVIPREHVLAMARNMDLNKDGQIDFNEFLETFRIVDQFGRDLVARRASEDSSVVDA